MSPNRNQFERRAMNDAPSDRQQTSSTDERQSVSEPIAEIAADQIFAGGNEIWITHQGERYRLRITRRGRLILTK